MVSECDSLNSICCRSSLACSLTFDPAQKQQLADSVLGGGGKEKSDSPVTPQLRIFSRPPRIRRISSVPAPSWCGSWHGRLARPSSSSAMMKQWQNERTHDAKFTHLERFAGPAGTKKDERSGCEQTRLGLLSWCKQREQVELVAHDQTVQQSWSST